MGVGVMVVGVEGPSHRKRHNQAFKLVNKLNEGLEESDEDRGSEGSVGRSVGRAARTTGAPCRAANRLTIEASGRAGADDLAVRRVRSRMDKRVKVRRRRVVGRRTASRWESSWKESDYSRAGWAAVGLETSPFQVDPARAAGSASGALDVLDT